MSKVKLSGLDIAVKDLCKTIQISKDDFSHNIVDKKSDIKIDIFEHGKVVNSMTTENLIQGLIVCSNYYLSDTSAIEDVKRYRCRLEKLIKKGAIVKVDMLNKEQDIMRLTIHIKGRDKYNFYSKTLMEAVKFAEEYNTVLKTEL